LVFVALLNPSSRKIRRNVKRKENSWGLSPVKLKKIIIAGARNSKEKKNPIPSLLMLR
jgi:hypothetical protein